MNQNFPHPCPYCNQMRILDPDTEHYRCPNVKCRSHIFVEGNRVVLLARPDIGVGKIIAIRKGKASEENPYSFDRLEKDKKQQESESDSVFNQLKLKYCVDFNAFLEQLVYPEEIDHYLWETSSKLKVNDKIGTVIHRNLTDATCIVKYELEFGEGSIQQIPETQIQDEIKTPLDIFLKGQIDRPEQFVLRFWGHQIHDLYASNLLKIVTNSRLSLLPHQISVAHTLLESVNARFILADEVGLGKTIEAGIYIKEMLARGLAKRVLIVVPASIVGQWEFELKNKFSLDFHRITASLSRQLNVNYKTGNLHHKDTGQEYTLCTASLQYARLTQCANLFTQIEWDIVIFDEAHHLRRYLTNQKTEQYHSTLAFTLAQQLAQKTRSILLLTATPIQLHSFDLYSLIELLNPFEFPTFMAFETARQQLPVINQIVRNLRDFTRINAFERKALENQIAYFDIGIPFDQIEEHIKSPSKRLELITRLEKKHFLSRYVIRNRRRIVFPNSPIKRIPLIIEVDLTPDELVIYNKIHDYLAKIYSVSVDSGLNGFGFVMVVLQKLLTSSAPALLKSMKKRIEYLKENKDTILKLQSQTDYEREFADDESSLDSSWGLNDFDLEDREVIQARKRKTTEKKGEKLNIDDHIKILSEFVIDLQKQTTDSKSTQLMKLITKILTRDPKEKILIFTQFKQTLFYLKSLLEKLSYKVVEFHGDLNEQQKSNSVYAFRHEIPIMLSTEIGGEGRNFQFCHIIVNYDLPWNPMRLEQRIGRLDRLGQTHNVSIYNFYIKNTVESSIITAIEERIHIFEESIGALEPILGSLEHQIAGLVMRQDDTPLKFRLDEVIHEATNEIETVEAKLEDFILDKRSFQFDKISKEINRPELITGIDFIAFLKLFIPYLEKTETAYSSTADSFQLKPIEKSTDVGIWMLSIPEDFRQILGLPNTHQYGVFDLDLATTQEEYDFFALGHPYIMKFAEWCQRDDFGGFASIIPIKSSILGGLFLPPYGTRLTPVENITLQRVLKEETTLNLFLFEIEFLGILVEKIVVPIFITDEGDSFPTLNDLIRRPHNLKQILDINSLASSNSFLIETVKKISPEKLQECYQAALQFTKVWIKTRAEELIELNKSRFEQEYAKMMRTADYKKKYAETQAKLAEEKFRAKKMKLPTERQLQNLESIIETAKKQARKEEFAKIRSEVEYYEQEIVRWKRILEDLDFDMPEQMKRLKKYRMLNINANFLGYARILFV